METGLRELFPFGDIDGSVIGRAAERFPGLPVHDVDAGLGLARSALRLLEELPRPIFDSGLTPARWRLLIALIAQTEEGGARIGELARHLGVKEPTVTATVDRLEKDGLVARERNDADRRIVCVTITPAGMAVVGSLIPTISHRVQSLVAALGGSEATSTLAVALDDAVTHAAAERGDT